MDLEGGTRVPRTNNNTSNSYYMSCTGFVILMFIIVLFSKIFSHFTSAVFIWLCILFAILLSILRAYNVHQHANSRIFIDHPFSTTATFPRVPLNLQLALIDRDFDENDYETLLALDENTPTMVFAAAAPEQIGRLPIQTLQPETITKEPMKACPICLEPFQVGDTLRTMPCMHKFHSKCLDHWLSIKATCPICKFDLLG